MIYAKVDVKLRDHERAHRAGVAMATWTWGLLYAVEQETDGFIPDVALRLAWPGEKEARRHVAVLVGVGLWEVCDGGWRVCRFATKNRTKAQAEQARQDVRERVRAHRRNTTGNGGCNALLTEQSAPLVPRSRSGSGSRSESPEGEPEREPPPESGAVAVPSRPAWFDAAVDSAEMTTGETFDRGLIWLKYESSRVRMGRVPDPADLRSFLASWADRNKQDRMRAPASGTRLRRRPQDIVQPEIPGSWDDSHIPEAMR